MTITRRALGLLGLAAAIPARAAEAFPDRPIHLVVPFLPGGAQDIVDRALARQMTGPLGQTIIVDNRPGAGGNIAVSFVVRSQPDGYTVLGGANGIAANATLFDNLTFDAQRDLAPVGSIGYSPLILLSGKDFKARTVADVVAMARAKPGTVTFASAGSGTSSHLAAELFRQTAGVEMRHVPYRGGAPAMLDVVAGRVDTMVVDPVQAMSLIRAGDLRPIAISAPTRLSLLPDVPTIEEAGLKGPDMVVWWGLLVPVKTPAPVIARLNQAMNQALTDPDLKARMTEMGIVLTPGTPAEFGTFIKAETDRYRTLIKAADIKPE